MESDGDKLLRLERVHASGALSDADYEAMKAELLAKSEPAAEGATAASDERGVPAKKKGSPITVAVLSLAILGGLFALTQCKPEDKPATGAEIEQLVKDVCRDSARKQLKDPKSAEFSDETLTKTGPSLYEASGTIRSRNSFGGMAVVQYDCKATWAESSQTATARTKLTE